MPIYVYRCDSCRSQIEKRQSFSDAPLTECEACGGALRRVVQPAAVVFKGSGFYVTDNRAKTAGNGTSSATSPSGKNGSESKASGGASESGKEKTEKTKEKTESAVSAD